MRCASGCGILRLGTFLAFLLWLLVAAFAQDLPRPNDVFVNDYANVLTADEIDAIRQRLTGLKEETAIEMTVLTVHSIADYGSTSIERTANDIFNAWGIGRAQYNDGILVLMATNDREMRVELGAGYDQGYDVLAQDIVNRWILPELRAGHPGGAVLEGTRELIDRIAMRHIAGLDPEPLPFSLRDWLSRLSGWILGIFFGALALMIAAGQRIADWSFRFWRCPSCGQVGLHRKHEPPTAGAGSGLQTTNCRHCDWRDERPWRPRMRSG